MAPKALSSGGQAMAVVAGRPTHRGQHEACGGAFPVALARRASAVEIRSSTSRLETYPIKQLDCICATTTQPIRYRSSKHKAQSTKLKAQNKEGQRSTK